jgi:hypothetical protein
MSRAFDTGEPYTGLEVCACLQRLHEESERYLLALPVVAFVSPQAQKWSPADHVRHLSKSTFPVARALGLPRLLVRLRFGRHAGASRPFTALREDYRARLQAGGTAGRFAPSHKPLPTDLEAYRLHVLGSWRQATTSLTSLIEGWPEPALDRCRLPHPLLGLLTVREMLFFTLYHNAHHLDLVTSRFEGLP